jgi:hypothetical protein
MQPTFRERYCQSCGLALEQFDEHLLRRGLYLHARPLAGLLGLIPDYFIADHEFIRSVGDLRTRRYFHAEAGEYHTHTANRGFLRRWLRLRVSAERVRRAMEEHWGTAESASPLN